MKWGNLRPIQRRSKAMRSKQKRKNKKPTAKRQKIEFYDRLGFRESVRHVESERPPRLKFEKVEGIKETAVDFCRRSFVNKEFGHG